MAFGVAEVLGGAVGGSVVQSLAAFAANSAERGRIRADVVRLVAAVETARWAPGEWSDLRHAVGELRAGCVVAGIPRDRVEQYIYFAAVAARKSRDRWEEYGEVALAGIPLALANLTHDAAAALVAVVWGGRTRWRRLLTGHTTAKDVARFAARRDEVETHLAKDLRDPVTWDVRM